MQPRRLLLGLAVTGILIAPAGLRAQAPATGNAQTPAAGGAQATGQKNWKDRAEYDLYDAISKDTNPQSRLEKLKQWQEKYPTSDFADLRQEVMLKTYAQLN